MRVRLAVVHTHTCVMAHTFIFNETVAQNRGCILLIAPWIVIV